MLRVLLAVVLAAPAVDGNASKVNEVIVQIKNTADKGSPLHLEVREADLNAWVAIVAESRPELGVKQTRVELLGDDRLRAAAEVDMDQVKLEGLSVQLFRTVLSGVQRLEVEGRLECSDGQARYVLERASLNGVALPAWLATQVLSYLSSHHSGGVDVTEPFDLPYGIRDVSIVPGKVVITR
ncbi:MAG: hypothetical protein Kow00109_20940 [Acidobacteriota bacterium]